MRERYDWTDEEYEQEWDAAKTNPNAVWSKDEYGVDTVSLLRTTTAKSSRKLSHQAAVSRKKDADGDDLEESFTRFLDEFDNSIYEYYE